MPAAAATLATPDPACPVTPADSANPTATPVSDNHPIYRHAKTDRTGRTTYDSEESSNRPVRGFSGSSSASASPTTSTTDRPGRRGRRRNFLQALVSKFTGRGSNGARGTSTSGSMDSDRLLSAVLSQALKREATDRIVVRSGGIDNPPLADVVLARPGEPKLPDEVFGRMRWGGVFAYADGNEKSVRHLAESFDGKRGFILEQAPTHIHAGPPGLRIPGITPRGHYFIARKTALIQPGDTTERFTYEVHLTRQDDAPGGYIVTKQVPTFENLHWRLKKKFPNVDDADLANRARKLVDTVFPTFLTREAAILKILAKHLPEPYCYRVPSCLSTTRDHRGLVTELTMNWLRNGGQPLEQIEFARQSAELLTVLHDHARVIHLDLRLDNFVITEDGVGFVDFGSAVRIGENLGQSPMLETLFSEMMRTSQIQRMLGKMLERGDVTNHAMRDVHGKVDKTVDAFYLAVQIAKPTNNPELRTLINYDPQTEVAQRLKSLTAAILRPKNPHLAEFKTAADILRGIRRIESKLDPDNLAA